MQNMLEPEYQDVFNSWKKEPSPKTNQALVQALDPVISSALTSYGQGAPSPALRTQAKLMTLEAAKRYDPSRAKLRTHLMTQLQGLRRVAGQDQNLVRVPEHLVLNQSSVSKARTELTEQLNREPSDAELADFTGLSLKKLTKLRNLPVVHTEGGAYLTDDEGGPVAPGVVDNDDSAWKEFVYMGLTPTDQFIMQHTLGLYGNKKLSTSEIAKRLRITPGAVSQKAMKIQAQLDARNEVNLL